MAVSAAPSSGKNTQLQEFRESDVVRWRRELASSTEEVAEMLCSVLEAPNAHSQLSSIKKLTMVMKKADTSTYSRELLCVMVEVHAVCVSRHPVQRAIASILQGLPQSLHSAVEGCVHATIGSVLSGDWVSHDVRRLQYVEVLMENPPRGEGALRQRIPLVLDYCVSAVLCYCKESLTDGVAIVAMKTTMNILHRMLPVVQAMMAGANYAPCSTGREEEKRNLGSCVITWPDDLCGELVVARADLVVARQQWVEQRLERTALASEGVLERAPSVPHDATVTAAMLRVVLFLVQFSGQELYDRVEKLMREWLGRDSSLVPFARLAICHAMLAKLPPSVLLGVTLTGVSLLEMLFPTICQLFNSFTETSDRYIASRTLALWSTVTKECVVELESGSSLVTALQPSGRVVQTLLQYVWSLWEDPVDGIRHQCRTMFENIIGIYKQLQPADTSFLLSLARSLLSLESPSRGKFVFLSSLSAHLPVSSLLQASPQLPRALIGVMGHQALACHAGELWSRLVSLHWQSLVGEVGVWRETWVDCLVQFMCTASPLARWHTTQHCLPSLFQCTESCLTYISEGLEKLNSVPAESKLLTHLACLHCAKRESKGFQWESSYLEVFCRAMHHADEQIRLSALGLLCESHRSTDPPLPSFLPLVLQFVELNGNSQSPGFRHPAINTIKKLLIRLKDSSYALAKQYRKRKRENPSALIASFKEFLHQLLSQQFEVLHPLSSYQRRNFALSLLQLLATIFQDHPQDSPIPPISDIFNFPFAVSLAQARCLVYALQDSFDANRAIVLDLLLKIPADRIGLEDRSFLEGCVKRYHHLATSPKAVSCTAAAFLLKLLVHKKCKEFNNILQIIVKEGDIEGTASLSGQILTKFPEWATIGILCQMLHHHMSVARKNLVRASITHPMYGLLQSIRAALEEAMGLSSLSGALALYRSITAEIIGLCEQVAGLVSPVVCNSSPEGFLPESSLSAGSGLLKSSLPHASPTSASAQSLLICCWHSMKEIALLMRLLVERAPIGSEATKEGVITPQQLDTIAGIFLHQLTEARHRGAFEMAHTGFSKLCHCLWTSPSLQLHTRPQTWVGELLESLQSTSLSRLLSITRRSAGLPFYLQAILTSEPSHSGRPCLKSTMDTLLRVARTSREPLGSSELAADGDSEGSSTEIRPQPAAVHALNILQALYRDSHLGESIAPFIPEGVVIAVEGFSASFWPVRNSSTLLFSALVTRIFGAKKVQDEHSIENKITAKEFFTRFPTLHGFLLEQVEVAAQALQQGSLLQPSLFPVLLLLSRLYPSPLDEPHSPISLKPFLPLLLSCVCSPVWKTRVLISRAVAPMFTTQNIASLLQEVVDLFSLSDQNSLHGLLLIVERLVIDCSSLLRSSCDGDGGTVVALWVTELMLSKCWVASRKNPCLITRCLYLEVIVSLLKTCFEEGVMHTLSPKAAKTLSNILQEAQDCILEVGGETKGGIVLSRSSLFVAQSKLLMVFAQHSEGSDLHMQCLGVCEILSVGLRHHHHLVRQYTLEEMSKNHENSNLLHKPLSGVLPLVLKLLKNEGDEDVLTQVYSLLVGVIECSGPDSLDHWEPDFTSEFAEVLENALALVQKKCIRMELKLSLIHFLSVALASSQPGQFQQCVREWVSLLEASSSPTQPVELREAVASELGRQWGVLMHGCPLSSAAPYCQVVVGLLRDVDCDVREEMARSVGRVLAEGSHSGDPGVHFERPSASSALREFLKKLTTTFPGCEQQSFSILLSCFTFPEQPPVQPADSNILFDEDPINNYTEETLLVQNVCACLQDLIITHYAELRPSLEDLVWKLLHLFQSSVPNDCAFSPWENASTFSYLCKLLLLARVVLASSLPDLNVGPLRELILCKFHDSVIIVHPLLHSILKVLYT